MDCFIIRVYRHITQENGQPDEIAGLVERVGRQDNGKPFSSYRGLMNTLRDEYSSDSVEAADSPCAGAGRQRLLHAIKNQ
jgi:hypothetical protein